MRDHRSQSALVLGASIRWLRTTRFALASSARAPRASGKPTDQLVIHGNKLLAAEEQHLPFAFDAATLASEGYWDFGGALTTGKFTAHPKIDPRTGEMIFFGYNIGGLFTSKIAYGAIDRAGKLSWIAQFEAPFSAMMHDFLVTENYILFPVLPLIGSLERAMKGAQPFVWEPQRGAYVALLRRDEPQSIPRWFRCNPCYVYHGMNAYEDGAKIVAHVMQYETPPLFPDTSGQAADIRMTTANLFRWTFDWADKSDSFKQERIDDLAADFPRTDDRFMTRKYAQGFFVATKKKLGIGDFDTLVRIDLQTGERMAYTLSEGDVVSEPVFVPKSTDAAEADGYILATIYRREENRSNLAMFEAATLPDGPIAVAELSHHVPMGFHGNWLEA